MVKPTMKLEMAKLTMNKYFMAKPTTHYFLWLK
jgi:hypothetical protein